MTKTAALIGLINAFLILLTAFGVELSDAQRAAIVTAVNAVLVAAAAWLDPSIPWVGRKDSS